MNYKVQIPRSYPWQIKQINDVLMRNCFEVTKIEYVVKSEGIISIYNKSDFHLDTALHSNILIGKDHHIVL